MPVDPPALDRFAREVAEHLTQKGGRRAPGADEHLAIFTTAIAAVASVHILADPGQGADVRMRALHAALEGLFTALAREGALADVLDRLKQDFADDGAAARSSDGADKSPAAHLARLVSSLCVLATSEAGQDAATVERCADQLLVGGAAAAELRWFVSSGRLTHERVRALARELDPRAGAELAQRVRELESSDDGFPFVPMSIAGTALADGTALQGGDLRSGSGLAAREERVVDEVIRAAARTAPVVSDYQRMRAARKRLDDDGWAGAARRFEEAAASIVPLVVELVISEGHPVGWERWAVEKRIANVVARQGRLRASLPRLRDGYHTTVESYLSAERAWKATFKAAVLASAAPGVLDRGSLRYLREEYPQLAITRADLGPAVSGAPPPVTAAAATPPAAPPLPADAGPPTPDEPATDAAPEPDRTPEADGEPDPSLPEGGAVVSRSGRAMVARLAVGVVAAAVGAAGGYGVAILATPDATPRVSPATAVTAVDVPAPKPGTRVVLHLGAFPSRGGAALGPFDEADTAGVAECTPDVIRVPEITAHGQRYEVRVTAGGTSVIFGDRATLEGPTPFTYTKARSVDGAVPLHAGAVTTGFATVRAGCPASALPPVTMARAVPADTEIASSPPATRSAWDPGPAGYGAGAVVVVAAIALLVRGLPRARPWRAVPALLLVIGAGLLGYTAHRGAAAHEATGDAAGVQTAACSRCPAGIRVSATEVQARADSDLIIFRGSWAGLTGPVPLDLHLVANDVNIVLRHRLDPTGFQLMSATRAGKPLDADAVAAGVRPGAFLINVKQSSLSEPINFGLEVISGADIIATVPAGGRLLWDGTGDPAVSRDTAPASPPAPRPSSPAPGTATSATPAATAAPTPAPTPVPPADLLELVRSCSKVAGGRLADDITPGNLVFGAAPDLKTSASTHYLGSYFEKAGFAKGLGDHAPFSITVAVRRVPTPGSGPLAIDAVGDIQLVAYWDGRSLSRGVRTFAGGQWTMHRDDDAARALTVEVRPAALVFYWNGFQAGDKVGLIASDGHGCANLGVMAPSTPVAPLPL